jgi:hypothetical protein
MRCADKLKNGTIAKLAAKVSELYEAAADSATEATQGGEKQTWPLFMFPFVRSHSSHFFALTCTQSMVNHMRLKKAHFAAAAQYRKSCDDLSANRCVSASAQRQVLHSFQVRRRDRPTEVRRPAGKRRPGESQAQRGPSCAG